MPGASRTKGVLGSQSPVKGYGYGVLSLLFAMPNERPGA